MIWFLCFWLAVIGAAAGSFIDCAVSRWAAGEKWHTGRSRCVACGHTLGAGELIPVISWLIRRGKCRWCGASIPPECLAAELAGAAGFACLAPLGIEWASGNPVGFDPALGQWVIFAGLLLALSLADAARRILPDRLLLALGINRLAWFLLLREPVWETGRAVLLSAVIPAVLLGLVLLAEKLLKREVMGGGDIKLLFALALYLAWAELLLALLAGCLLGLAWAAVRGKKDAIPFGPFLAAGAVLSAAFGGPGVEWYLGLL